ncbi:hypothetical protein GE061_011483 [Apolygus lucorum]|uniref:BTB domain-containing protein n=1 Tax=Apolygus lucorum TaxID=248454 RepID=A0A8S9XZL2_APOLU|nr:hypothetical protein GE061_011483 [Apolygus lucorum]
MEELPRDLWRLFKSGNYADRCFVVGGEKMMAHSAILAARSPEVSKLFADGSNEVVIKDIKADVFEGVLQSIYTETMVQNLDERAEDLLMAANMFGMSKLKQRAENSLIQKNFLIFNIRFQRRSSPHTVLPV